MQFFNLNFAKISVFQTVTIGYIKPYKSKKINKVVNNTPTLGF